ncbi:MAG: DNA gyrase/topoisomerase IV subunit A [Verrucomicrobiota bacterium]
MPSKRPPSTPDSSGDDQLAFDLTAGDSPDPMEAGGNSADTPVPENSAVPTGPRAHPALADTSFSGTGGTPLRLHHVGEMYGHWFLDYASYVILERAVPHLNDGLKPVQRRILHSMERMDDGRFNKVANIVGETMKYHPHGDSAITEALVGLGQKDLLVETQGNWGNILTGDEAAAGRYIEARLSKFALDVLFNARLTLWASSYDGRNPEPVDFPAKFPILLAQGVEGIAVGLACKILPHNFNELIDACIDSLRGNPFTLVPDFATAAIMDASEYNDGLRGGKVRVRARIEETKKKGILRITEIPFGTTSGGLIDSIISANEKGKIKIAKVEDMTAEKIEILIHLAPGTEGEEMLPALYVFTDCEVSISPNAVVIRDNKPAFLSVSELLKQAAAQTKDLHRQELEMRLSDLEEKWHSSSLEKIFIENRIYRDIEECTTWDAVMAAIWKGLKPFLKLLRRAVTDDDVKALTEIKIKRISKFNSFEANEFLRGLENQIEETKGHLAQLTRYTINWFKDLKKKYGADKQRRTEITTFDRVAASAAAVATETLYIQRAEGYIGYGLKRGGEVLFKCSRLDDIIVFQEDGTVRVSRVTEKAFFGPNPMHIALFDREATPVYTLFYRDGARGRLYAKRFTIGGVTRDTVYDLTKGSKGSKVFYFATHPTEADSDTLQVVVHLQPAPRLRKLEIEVNMADLPVKNRSAQGNIVAETSVKRVARRR